MLDCLPDQIEPLGLAEAGRSFHGEISVGSLSRLRDVLVSRQGQLVVELDFRVDERRVRVLSGHLHGQLVLTCQRCLTAMPYVLDLNFRLGIIAAEEEAGSLPAGYEALLAAGEPLPLAEVIEDEIILALPTIPKHLDETLCRTGVDSSQFKQEKPNPFAVLKQLKTK